MSYSPYWPDKTLEEIAAEREADRLHNIAERERRERIVPVPKTSTEYQLRLISAWWDEVHQWAGLPHACFTLVPSVLLGTNGARRDRASGWKWYLPHYVLALPRGGYGSLWLHVFSRPQGGKLLKEEQDVHDQLRRAGNCVMCVHKKAGAVKAISDYVAGKIVKPKETEG